MRKFNKLNTIMSDLNQVQLAAPAVDSSASCDLIKNSIRRMVNESPYRTFANFCKIDGFQGNLAIALASPPNVVLWPEVSQEGARALGELIDEKAIFTHPASLLSYCADGRVVTGMPMVRKKPPKAGYKKPRWLPVCFCNFPMQ